jgi:F0F1-type ATP synthase beta subunit
MLAGSKVALFHGALVGKTLGPFQKQFHAFATAKAANCTFISCQFISPFYFK